jgi:glutamate synthase domain-containing protein 2
MDPALRESRLFDRATIAEIQRAAREGMYDIRGFGAKRSLPHFDDLLLLGASVSRYPLEGYRERCATDVVLGTRFARRPLELKIPVTIAGMSFGALSAPAKEALGRAATEVGTSTTTGDGGMTPEERESSKTLVYQLLPSRYGMNPDDLRRADAIEVVVGQGAKPGGGGMLLGHKISDRVAEMRDLPRGIDQRSASRHPDWTGPDDLEIKLHELREITDWEKPIFVKVGATRPYYDDWQAGLDPAGITTQDEELSARLDPVLGGRRVANYLRVMTLEAQTLARACGKSHVHNLEPEDLVALTVEAAAMAKVPLAGTDWIPGA